MEWIIKKIIKWSQYTRNGYNIFEMDIEIFNSQKRLKKLEDDTNALEDNDYDETLLLLIK